MVNMMQSFLFPLPFKLIALIYFEHNSKFIIKIIILKHFTTRTDKLGYLVA